MPVRDFQFVITEDRNDRVILSVTERKKTFDLTLGMRQQGVYRDAGIPIEGKNVSDRHGKKIINQYYSIHPSPESPENNLIKHTLSMEGFPDIQTRQFTTAIKSGVKFAHIFSGRFGRLSNPVFDVRKNRRLSIHLGPSHSAIFLIISVFVASHNTRFTLTAHDLNVVQSRSTLFNLVILWSFLTIPAQESGNISQ